MKIEVDFVRAEQHWDPDSGEQQNYLVFAFAGKEFSVAVEEADIVATIRGAAATTQVSTLRVDEEPDGVAEEMDRVFGGDTLDTSALPTTEPEEAQVPTPRPASAQEQRKAQIAVVRGKPNSDQRLEALRKRAMLRPPRTVRATDGGYPDVEVTTVPLDTKTSSTGTDDDGFEPG